MMMMMFQECHHNMLQYEFPSSGLCLSSVFAVMEEACRDLPIDDYSINQNTLDNVIETTQQHPLAAFSYFKK